MWISVRIYVIVFVYLVCTDSIYALDRLKRSLGGRPYKLCVGAKYPDEASNLAEAHVVKSMRSLYGNCTHLTGHLSIYGLKPDDDASFLSSIEDVTGSVFIHGNRISTIPLNNLRVIRGHVGHTYINRTYSLFVSRNNALGTKVPSYINFTSLRAIVEKDVYFGYNPSYCNFGTTINWTTIFENTKKQKIVVSGNDKCPVSETCSPKCPKSRSGKQYCWGPTENMCQQVESCDRTVCPDNRARCFSPANKTDGRCCHEECIGGCSGITRSDCFACRHFLNGKECLQQCPAQYIYSHKEFKYIPNPGYKVALGLRCIDKCPDHFLIQEGGCVKSCSGAYRPVKGICKPCKNGVCLNDCKLETLEANLLKNKPCAKNTYLYHEGKFTHTPRSVILALKNCTSVSGNFKLTGTSKRDHGCNESVRAEDLQNLKNLKSITGDVHLMLRGYPEIKNLSFLSNLEELKLPNAERGGFSISFSKMEYLGLTSLKTITGKVVIAMNSNLCYLDIFRNGTFSELSTKPILMKNKQNSECVNSGKVCHPECNPENGCWGPGNAMCFSCRNKSAGKFCVVKCEDIKGYFTNATGKCEECHPECLKSCKGKSSDQCIGGCKNAKDGPYCVAKCPLVKYLNHESGVCKDCSPDCFRRSEKDGKYNRPEPACSGNSNLPKPGGCTQCDCVEVHRNKSLSRCMPECGGKGYATVRRSIREEVKRKHPSFKKQLSFSNLYMKCHQWCLSCYGERNTMCETCRLGFFKHEDTTCLRSCPRNTYNSTNSLGEPVCLPCDSSCADGCRGKTNYDCFACTDVKIYLNGSKVDFYCNKTCPSYLKYKISEKPTGKVVCSKYPPSGSRLIIGLVVAALLIIIIVVAGVIFVCVQKRRARLMMDRDLLRAKYTRKLDQELVALNTTDYQPNVGQLRMINTKRLAKAMEIGSGAFGTVFKGIWRPEKESPDELEISIDVAIKELKESGNLTSTKDFLSEAHVMASVDHPFCMGLLGVCLTTRMQLISEYMPLGSLVTYLPKHKHELGSQRLITWAMQIAKGMAYLESHGIVHRDLAARNVLLQNEEQVRITDFGLAKLLDPGGEEIHAETGRFPVKWLAIESLLDRTFSHKSDVWSFGVTLWEIFMFGERPYQDIRAREMFDFLDSGERLSQPPICTLDMYMLLIKCWLLEPEGRPTFSELVEDISQMASDPGRYLIIENDSLRRAPVREGDRDSTTPRMSNIYLEKKQNAPTVVNLPPPAGLPHLESQLANRRKPPSTYNDHYTDDPVSRGDHPSAHLPPPPPLPVSNEEDDDVQDSEQDYLLPDADASDDYLPPTPQPQVQLRNPGLPKSTAQSAVPPPPPDSNYVNVPHNVRS